MGHTELQWIENERITVFQWPNIFIFADSDEHVQFDRGASELYRSRTVGSCILEYEMGILIILSRTTSQRAPSYGGVRT